MAPSSSSSAPMPTLLPSGASPLGTAELRRDCGYCANAKTLRALLPPKQCNYCSKFKCQFCTLRFPLLKVKRGLPKAMKGNSRICLDCFHEMWTDHVATSALTRMTNAPALTRCASLGRQSSAEDGDDERDSLRDSMLRDSFNHNDERLSVVDETPAAPSMTPSTAKRVARALGLVVRTDAPTAQAVVSVVILWLSMYAAATLLVVVLADHLTLQQRVAFCVVVFGGFLAVHPWIHNAAVSPLPRPARSPTLLRCRSTSAKSITMEPEPELEPELTPKPVDIPPSSTVPAIFRPTLEKMQERVTRYLSDPTQWKLVKATSAGSIYEIPNELPQTLLMLDMFVQGISIADFLSYMNRTDVKDRSAWDWNVGAFEIVEAYADDDACIVYNAQKAFLGGFVSARDFCLLYKRLPTSIVYASVEHPKVPERPHAMRGLVHLAALHCTPTTDDKGENGFQLQYMVQVDIGGNIPARLMYNGQVDNLEKNIKSFRQAHKLFTK